MLLRQIFANLHVCLHEVAPVMEVQQPPLSRLIFAPPPHGCTSPHPTTPLSCITQLDDMRRAFMLRGAVVTALVHGDTVAAPPFSRALFSRFILQWR